MCLSTGPVVNKMVFSIVIVSISIVILAILFLVWKKGKCGGNSEENIEEENIQKTGKIANESSMYLGYTNFQYLNNAIRFDVC
jgi:hypothetical protein